MFTRTNLYLAIAVAAGLIGCGSSSDGSTSTTPSSTDSSGTGSAAGASSSEVANEFDPADTGANVGQSNLKYKTDATSGAQIWVKNEEGSELMIGNSSDNAEVTPVNSHVKLTSLANIVISRHGNPTDEIRYAGQKWDDAGGINFRRPGSLQRLNHGRNRVRVAKNENIENIYNRTSALLTDTRVNRRGLVVIGKPTYKSPDGNRFFGEESDFDSNPKVTASAHARSRKSLTRVFGRAYNRAWESPDGSSPIPATRSSDFSGVPTVNNSYSNTTLTKNGAVYNLEAIPMKLSHVQYGRVTVNMNDAAATTMGQSVKDGDYKMVRIPFANKGDANSVDSYFVRGMGTSITTIAQMEKLPSEGVYAYRGHAIMYGLDNADHRGGNAIPNGGGASDSRMVGNFVQLDFNLATRKIENGQVYNIWQDDLSIATLNNTNNKDILVNFSGDVVGNTIIGTADRAYVSGNDDNGFTGTFYGENADEVGGAFGVNRSTGYSKTVGWGGVFGAKKIGTGSIAIDAN